MSVCFDALAAHDGVERRRAAQDVVGFDREHFAQRVCRAVAEQRPHFHFAEALAAVLRLAAERLLGDERVRADGAHVDLVLHHVVELQDVHVADRDRPARTLRRCGRRRAASCRFRRSRPSQVRRGFRRSVAPANGGHDGLVAERVRREPEVESRKSVRGSCGSARRAA